MIKRMTLGERTRRACCFQRPRWKLRGTCLTGASNTTAGAAVLPKLDAKAVLAASAALSENVNYAVKSREGRHVAVPNFRDADTASLPFLESVPEV